jgi:transcription termination factor NusA
VNRSPETAEALFVRILEINGESALALIERGFSSLEEIAYVPVGEFLALGVLGEKQIQTVRARARKHRLSQELGDPDDSDPVPSAVEKPPRPTPDGSSVPMDRHEKKDQI